MAEVYATEDNSRTDQLLLAQPLSQKEHAGQRDQVLVDETPFHDRYTPPDVREKQVQGIPMGREGTPEERVGAMLSLASSADDYLVGEIVEANDGQLMS